MPTQPRAAPIRRALALSLLLGAVGAWLASPVAAAGLGKAKPRVARAKGAKPKARRADVGRDGLAKRRGQKLQRILDRTTISRDGHVDSIQRARLANTTNRKLRTPSTVSRAYEKHISSVPLMHASPTKNGGVAFKIGPVALIELGPAARVGNEMLRRSVVGGLLVPRGERGRGRFEVRRTKGKHSTTVEVGIHDYRSSIRGTNARAPLRSLVYRVTQLAIHRWVATSFLRSLAK